MKVHEATSTALGAGIAAKASAALGAGVVGGLVMAAVSREHMTRREVALRGAVAGVGSLAFGKVAVLALAAHVDFYGAALAAAKACGEACLDDTLALVIPAYLLVGALSWGVLGMVSKLNELIRDRGAKAVADRVLGPEDKQ